MKPVHSPIPELDGADSADILATINGRETPVVMRGLCSDWPLLRHRDAPDLAIDYLKAHDQGAPVTAFVADAEHAGRLFYNEQISELNFQPIRTTLTDVLDRLRQARGMPKPPTIYMGSMALNHCLPEIKAANSLPSHDLVTSVRIWIGNASRVAAHHDVLDNIACVCAGKRRFTLFPPDQLANLYLGPLDLTPAGQQVSLVDPDQPDLARFPRYAEALEHAQQAELEPGDAIYIPSMWWHQVSALSRFNILINHWWRDQPAWMGAPADVLKHALLNLRDLPRRQRIAWQTIFNHYIFDPPEDALAHIPESQRGMLGGLDEDQARQLRMQLRNNLNR